MQIALHANSYQELRLHCKHRMAQCFDQME